MTASPEIQYRTFQAGDEDQLADLFNRAFQSNGGGFIRTPKCEHWRYVEEPGFAPTGVQVAECRGRIVGSVIISHTTANFFGKNYNLASVNDVATRPDFFGKGIARVLMDRAHQYMEDQNVDFATLDADPKGHPRAKLYLPLGYYDYGNFWTGVKLINIPHMLLDLKLILPILPATLLLAHARRCLLPRYNSGRFEAKVIQNKRYTAFRDAFNHIVPRVFEGYRTYTPEHWAWAREKVPGRRFLPSFAVVKEGRKIVAGASITAQNIYAFKYHFKFRVAVVHDCFVDNAIADTAQELDEIYDRLILSLHDAAFQRKCGVLLLQVAPQDKNLKAAIPRSGGFIVPLGSAHMFRPVKFEERLPPSRKPLYLFPEDTLAGTP